MTKIIEQQRKESKDLIDYDKKYDKKSLLWLFYFRWIIITASIFLISKYYKVSDQILSWWAYFVFTILIILGISMTILFLNGFVYMILRSIFKYHYEKSWLAKIIEKWLGRVFPKKLYSKRQCSIKLFSDLENKHSTIHLWIILNIFVFSTVLIRIILSRYEGIRDFINKNNDQIINRIRDSEKWDQIIIR